jgi:transposase-like protein/helix-turn-helix protein
MPQIQLPIFPEGATSINSGLAFQKLNGQVTYFNGSMPVFIHDEADLATFRMITSQFCINGNATQAQISRAFGVPSVTVKRYVKLYRKNGPAGFYRERRYRGATVLTPEVLQQAQSILDTGLDPAEVANQLEVKPDTLGKAIRAGRLHQVKKKDLTKLTSKSDRSIEDSLAPMGMGATNSLARIAASIGALNEVPVTFQASLDVPNGGILLALPALLANGLLHNTSKYFKLPRGYYSLQSIFLLLAFLFMCRIKFMESLRYAPPGEWGKLLGLDRIPEVRTIRQKIKLLKDSEVNKWSAELCADWMSNSEIGTGIFYVDGHVRVYHGAQTKLPRHYISRQRLCLRSTEDYWINAMDGQPFFLVNKAVDPGICSVLENDIVPRLLKEFPNQPTQEELEANPLLHRFTLVFDREGYSPKLIRKMKEKRIACLTYNKYPKSDWPIDEFSPKNVKLAYGGTVEFFMAERGTKLSNNLWVREIRKLTPSGHQTSILSTDYISDLCPVSAAMFARWCQENFFRYMREHYNLDRLIDYEMEEVSGDTKIVNPAYRALDGQVKSKVSVLNRKFAKFGALNLSNDAGPEQIELFQKQKTEQQEQIDLLSKEVEQLKAKRKAIAKHIKFSELPKDQQFTKLSTKGRHLIDTIKMIAYRAETAMANFLRPIMTRPDEARTLLRDVYGLEADLIPDKTQGTLLVRLHHLANHANDGIVRKLCEELNTTKTIFPGTNLTIIYELVS